MELENNFSGSRLIFYDGGSRSHKISDFFSSNPEINRESIFDFLLFGTILPPSSFLKGVNLLGPGETVGDGKSLSEYADLKPEIKKQGINDFVDDFEKYLREYFEKNKNSQPVLLISGGIDSAIILSFLGPETTCITWGSEGPSSSDVVFSGLTTKKFEVKNHHFVYADYEKDLESYKRAVEELGVPLLFQNSVPHIRMAEYGRELGIKNWFMGQNADTVLVSYPAPVLVRRLAMLNRFLPFNPFWFLHTRKKYLFSTPSIVRLMAYFKSSGLFPGPWLKLPEGYFEKKEKMLESLISTRDLRQKIVLMEEILTEARRNQIYQNDIPALYGIETKCPYYERKFVELALSIPESLRSKDKYGKVIFKELARRRGVPEEVITKPKKGLSYGYREFMRKKMHLPFWDKMEKDEFLNAFIDVKLARQERENNFFAFDCLFSLYWWGELVCKKRNLKF